MLKDSQWQALAAVYPTLETLPAGTTLFEPGTPCPGLAWLAAGSNRVSKLSESGRKLLLYRVYPGDTCVVTTGCSA
ncbi:hypothetical protein AAIA72_10450 [Hahella sp. SMD15-11]|uniref:Cyclic nucleotide-binding domain-containing protein n=1 Tax=Thermohahella caldifontis TaxID=3142973 RepID=A0AB39UTP8_9GAMM